MISNKNNATFLMIRLFILLCGQGVAIWFAFFDRGQE